MSDSCQQHSLVNHTSARYRLILWVALVLNAAMFFVEFWGGKSAESNALLADSIDFFGDAANYGLSLFVLSGSLLVRSRTAWFKGLCMALFGFFVIGRALWSIQNGATPEPFTMGWIGLLALVVNVAVAAMLYAYRTGDANMRSVWLCSRNDAIGNIAVMLAGLAVWYFVSKWPDFIVAIGMGMLALSSAWQVLRQAKTEMNGHRH
jgi:Co/Zn/Cd efflux system component